MPRLPGVVLCAALALAATALGAVERMILGRAWIEPLVLAILLGAVVRTLWTPSSRWKPGIDFSARQVLEVAIVLLGLTLNVPLLLRAGPLLAAGIIAAVLVALLFGVLIGRAFGLRHRLAILVAVGNAICGNSAIAAVAPVIGAEPDDVASSIAFTAVLGVAVVLALPFLVTLLGLSDYQYGVVAGLTVYAVPQVLAATLPVSALSGQVGTLVKLTRVLMLGPIVIGLSIAMRRRELRVTAAGATTAGAPSSGATSSGSLSACALSAGALSAGATSAGATSASASGATASCAGALDPGPTNTSVADATSSRTAGRGKVDMSRLVPWFIVGFVVLAAVRATGVLPESVVASARILSGALTIVAMAALGLGVDVRVLRRVGAPVTATAIGALLLLLGISIALARTLHVA